MTPCFITKDSRIWKTQIHKCYRITIDTNNYKNQKQKTQTVMKKKKKKTNYYEISRDTFWFTTSNTPLLNQKHLHTKHCPQSSESINW